MSGIRPSPSAADMELLLSKILERGEAPAPMPPPIIGRAIKRSALMTGYPITKATAEIILDNRRMVTDP